MVRLFIIFVTLILSNPTLSAFFATGDGHGIVIDKDGNAWTWGLNTYGQLGLGQYENLKALTLGSELASWLQEKSSNLWGWGAEHFKQLCGDRKNRLEPTRITRLNGIVSVYAKAQQSFAIDREGSVWAFGNNDKGQLGLGDAIKSYPYPTGPWWKFA